MSIDSIGKVSGTLPAALPTTRPGGQSDAGFGDALKNLIGAVDGSATEANDAVGRMLDGTGDVHQAVIAMQKADTALQLTVQIRNKIVQAYQDIMRMPV
jgi:flagellar hook-basal body complex protein FliE